MNNHSLNWSPWRVLLGIVIAEVCIIVSSALTDPTFLPEFKQAPWPHVLSLTTFGVLMYGIAWLSVWHRMIPREPQSMLRMALAPIGFVTGAVVGLVYNIHDRDFPANVALFTLLGGGLFSSVAIILRAPRDAIRGACAGAVVAFATVTYHFIAFRQKDALSWDVGDLAMLFLTTPAVGAVIAVYLLRILRFRKQLSARSNSD